MFKVEKMRVLLINPPQTQLKDPRAYIPLGLAYLASVLEESGVEVEVLNLANEKNVEKTAFPEADWYGITCTTATYRTVKTLVQLLKPKGKVVVGGPHPSVEPDETLSDMQPDHVVTGEAEFLFRDLVLGKLPRKLTYNAGIVKDLDTLPIPARHLFKYEDVVDYSGIHGQEKGVPATTIISSRGCPFNCNFCCKNHLMYQRYRYRSANNVKSELKYLQDRYGIEHVRFVDDEFTLNNKRVKALCNEISDLKMTWVCITRVDTTSISTLKDMKKGGCVEVHVGVESGSNRLLELMNKKVTAKTLLKGIKKIKDARLRVKTYLMYGYPGETEEDRELTLTFLRKAKPDKFTVSMFTPLAGSKTSKSIANVGWYYPDFFITYKEQIKEAIK